MEIPITQSELMAFGGLLSGLGTILLGASALYGVHRWKEQATFKDEFDLAIKVIETVCRAESYILNLEASAEAAYSTRKAESALKNDLPNLITVIEDLEALAVSVEALFTRQEAMEIKRLISFCLKVNSTTEYFYESIIEYNVVVECINHSKANNDKLKTRTLSLKEAFDNLTDSLDSHPKVNKEVFEKYNESIELHSHTIDLLASNEEKIKPLKARIDEKSKHFIWSFSESSGGREGSTFSFDIIPISFAVKRLMQAHLKRS
jgi:hypothetical protein